MRTWLTTLLQIFCKIFLDFKVIVKSIIDPDDNLPPTYLKSCTKQCSCLRRGENTEPANDVRLNIHEISMSSWIGLSERKTKHFVINQHTLRHTGGHLWNFVKTICYLLSFQKNVARTKTFYISIRPLKTSHLNIYVCKLEFSHQWTDVS